MPVSVAVCQPHSPDLMGRDVEQGVHIGDGDGKTQAASGKSEGGTADESNSVNATGGSGEGDWRGKGYLGSSYVSSSYSQDMSK